MAVTEGTEPLTRRGRIGRILLFGIIAVYLILPMVAVLLYSFATRWSDHILPDGYTLEWWASTLTNSAVQSAFAVTLVLATLTALLDMALVVPAAYWARVRNPGIRTWIEVSAAIPFALPYLVIAFGLLQFSGVVAPSLQGTLPLLVLGHTAIAFPFMYWAVDGSMAASGIEALSEAAETCGAAPWRIIVRVVLPNISAGIVSGAMLSFATSFGEFAMVQTLARGVYTVPIWSASQIRSYTGEAGAFNRLAAVTVICFVVLFVLSAIVVLRSRGQSVRLLPGVAANEGRPTA